MDKHQLKAIANYDKSGIKITPLDNDCIKIQQDQLVNGYIFTNKELFVMAKQLFPDKKIVPVTFSFQIEEVQLDWINKQMDKYGIYKKDLVKQLAIDKPTLSDIFKGKQNLSPTLKAAFYYYFLTFEINKNLRNEIL